jgi:hypothetical protein
VIEERVPIPVEQPVHVSTQRRYPVRIITMEAIGQINKALAVSPAAECGHLDRATARRGPFKRAVGVSGIWCAERARAIHQHLCEGTASLRLSPPPNSGLFDVGPYRKTEIPRSVCATRLSPPMSRV